MKRELIRISSKQFVSVSYICESWGIKGKERKGKENIYVERKGEKVAFMRVEPTPSAIRADVLNQLD